MLDRQTGLTTIASASGSGAIGNGASTSPSISADGLRIAFVSTATNLVVGDTNGLPDVFVRNLANNACKLVSRPAGGGLSDAASISPAISGDGRFIAFVSEATNLVPGHTGSLADVFVASFANGAIELVSVTSGGAQGDAASERPTLSHDGNRIVFVSQATNFAAIAAGSTHNAFLRDRAAGTTTLVNTLANGGLTNGGAELAQIASSGAFAVFTTNATNIDAGDLTGARDAYVKDLFGGTVLRASVPTTAPPAQLNSGAVAELVGVSGDGRYAGFTTAASNAAAGEPADGLLDVFRRDSLGTWYRDVDGDLFGDAADSVLAPFQPVGYVANDLDCDDGNSAVNPGVTEICNGIDDNCDGTTDENSWATYCVAGTSGGGCLPSIGAVGTPSISQASGFRITCTSLPGQRSAALIYGLAPTNVAWDFGSTSTRCVAFPWTRVTTFDTAGIAGTCSGVADIDWLAFMAANPGAQGQPVQPGDDFYAQLWYRDPGQPRQSNLTAAVSFAACP